MEEASKEPSHRIFICYRREDTGDVAPQLRTMLNERLGADSAFLDERDVPPGTRWPDELRQRLVKAELVVVLVGPGWLTASTDKGRRRLEIESDWVRSEIRTALDTGLPILPLTVGSDALPDREALPEVIEGLCDQQSTRLDIRAAEPILALIEARLHELRPDENDPLPRYRKNLRACHNKLVSFFPDAGDALISEVYVELELDTDIDRAERLLTRGKREPSASQHEPKTLEGLLQLPLEDGNTGRFVLLGEPGAGKSTLSRHLTHECAREDRPTFPLPVFLPLATWAASNDDALDLVDPGDARPTQRDALRQRIEALAGPEGDDGAVWMLLDGLDEVGPDHIQRLRKRLAVLVERLPKARFVVTTRAIGYRSLGSEWQHARLRPLTQERQGELLRHWLTTEKADELQTTIANHPEISRLAGNPLLLTLLASLMNDDASQRVPTTRTALHDRAISLLLEKGYGEETRPVKHPDEARRILQRLAFALQEHDAVAWSEESLLDQLDDLRAEDARLDRWLNKWDDAKTFLKDCANQSGILAPHDGPEAHWKFLHRQFREFLAAKEIANDQGDWSRLLEQLNDDNLPRWSETIGLVCGLSKEPSEVLRRLKEKNPAAAVRALGEIEGVPPAELLDLLDSIPTAPTKYQPAWQGDDLREAVDGWHRRGHASTEELRKLLMQRLKPVVDRASRIRAAWIHFALSALGPVPRAEFFERCHVPLASDAGPELLEIPAGTFLMGSPEDELKRSGSEGPQHKVTVPSFRLARHAVTNAQYAQFDPSHDPETFGGKIPAEELAHHPAVKVSWWEAWLYCAWIGARLPSEAEWEYACRAGTTSPFSIQGELTPELVNYDGNHPYADGQKGEYRKRTVRVGELSPNAWGLHEMHGNVFEWCEDRMHSSYEHAPDNGSAWITGNDRGRVLRGGSWPDFGRRCRCAYRGASAPGYAFLTFGFRPARSSH